MNFVRKGPRYLFFRTEEPDRLRDMLREEGGKCTGLSAALEQAEEESTIVFITLADKEKTRVEDAVSILCWPKNSLIVLENLINNQITNIINQIDMGPGQIVVRIPRDGLKVIEEIEEAYQEEPVAIKEGIDRGEANDTVLSFTEEPIRTKINSLDLVEKSLLISKPGNVVYKELRRDIVRYITNALESHQWYELKINIYDADGEYKIHYDRLVSVFRDLEAGFILGESWTKDHAFALMSVAAYQVRLFTFLAPKEIKKILISLEYDADGNRFVDYDLYHESSKVEWVQTVEERKNRANLGLELRNTLFSGLSEAALIEISELETKLKVKND